MSKTGIVFFVFSVKHYEFVFLFNEVESRYSFAALVALRDSSRYGPDSVEPDY